MAVCENHVSEERVDQPDRLVVAKDVGDVRLQGVDVDGDARVWRRP